MFPTEVAYTVAYTVREPVEREIRHAVLSDTVIEKWDLVIGVYHVMKVEIKNIDTQMGTFDVILELFDIKGSLGRYKDSHPLAPGETYAFSAWWDTNLGQDVVWEYVVYPPTVVDERLVTKYRTKYRTEHKSIVHIVLGR